MESRQAGIFRLCMIIGFFCVSIFFLNNNKKKFITATHIDVLTFKIDPTATLSVEQVYDAMNSLFIARDVDLIVKVLSQFKYRFAYDLIQKIVTDNTLCLSSEEKIKIIYGMVAHCATKKSVQYELLDLLIKYPHLHAQTPALLVLAQSKHTEIIGLFIAWGKDRHKNYPNLLMSYAEQAFIRAVENNDYHAVEILLSKKVRISSAKASALLWYIVEHDKNSYLVALLVRYTQADVNYTQSCKTLLIAAVEKNNIEIARILLDAGAVVDRMCTMGTALHVAMQQKNHTIELLLREYGAV
jgi:hypothetical protein